jgi:hypothetical protein
MRVGAATTASAVRDDLLGRPAVALHREERDHVVAHRDARHALADRVDRARDVVARDVRQLDRDGQEAAPHPAVRRAVRRGGDADPHLPGARLGLLDVDDPEDLGSAHL